MQCRVTFLLQLAASGPCGRIDRDGFSCEFSSSFLPLEVSNVILRWFLALAFKTLRLSDLFNFYNTMQICSESLEFTVPSRNVGIISVLRICGTSCFIYHSVYFQPQKGEMTQNYSLIIGDTTCFTPSFKSCSSQQLPSQNVNNIFITTLKNELKPKFAVKSIIRFLFFCILVFLLCSDFNCFSSVLILER